MAYDYSRLRGRIVEKCGTLQRFAEALGISGVSLNKKLKSDTFFKQPEIQKAMDILDIAESEVQTYFFNLKVQ